MLPLGGGSPERLSMPADPTAFNNLARLARYACLCVLGVVARSLAVCPDLYHPFPTSECRYRGR